MTTLTRSHVRANPPRWLTSCTAALIAINFAVGGAAAHGPDPALGGTFGQYQDLRFRWRAGAEPTTVIQAAIRAAADASNATRAARAATLTYDSIGANLIGYGLGATCGVNGLACFTRTVPSGFTMWLREQGHVFDWGTLKWCQAYTTAPSGCYDAETIALDEFGHVQGLNHHVNWSDDSDYEDAIVQTYSRTKPSIGWNRHGFGRCDIATLQLLYDVQSWSAKYSTCLDMATDLTLTAAPTGILVGSATTLTATLKVVGSASYGKLGGNPVAGRIVTLQRRAPGATAWITVGTMPSSSTAGTYLLSQRPSVDTEYRAVFGTPSDEGINGDASLTVRIYVSTCGAAVTSAPTKLIPCI